MTSTLQILIYSLLETSKSIDQTVLESAGYEVVIVCEPQELESWLKTWSVNTLLVLIHPDAREGLKRSAEILASNSALPIILVTTEANQALLKEGLEIGLVDYLTSPVEPDDLLGVIKRSKLRLDHLLDWNRYTRVLASLEDGFILANLDGHLLMINHSACEILQLRSDDIVGKPVNQVFNHPDLLDLFKPHNTFPHRSEITMEDGRIFSCQASLVPEIGIAVVMQDITHLKELDRIKTDFVNTVSHDIRSPLTAIYGFVGLIDRVGLINEQQAEFIHHIQTSVQHITSLINDLMDLGRVEADYDLQMEEVNLKDIIQQSIGDLEFQINEKMQVLQLSIPDGLPAILGNPLHLQRMITNLVENAVKFTPSMGKIDVRCRAEGNQLILEVADNGPGIPLADQPHIFEKFFRGSNLSAAIPGTGLGLSIVRTIVEKHHGRIWLESSTSGTTFSVILPVK
ncbi:MAG: ATP-binding protein [Acidobacteriaceae bacterium]